MSAKEIYKSNRTGDLCFIERITSPAGIYELRFEHKAERVSTSDFLKEYDLHKVGLKVEPDLAFCKDCKWIHKKDGFDVFNPNTDILCSVETDKQHPITGEPLCELCITKNRDCDCENFEQKEVNDE